MSVIHRPRVAWEGARAFVAAANTDAYWWLSEMVGRYLGVMYELQLAETRLRLQLEDEPFAETAAWRARLDDLLYDQAELTPLVLQLVSETTDRLPH
ncbi:hypothetical protein ACRYCC_42075 [Actinomadura scrupuli]|uniref:hypothetical protein n=1 Tax=Actinomadura scrupuli TaxID=559629 RepID=UPI003D9534A6